MIRSQIIGKCAKAISPGTREAADGLRLLAAQTELQESPVRGDRPVMGTSLSEPHSVTDGRSAVYSCVIEPYVGRAIPLDLNFQFPQAVYGQFTPCRGSKLSLQCDVFETVVPSLSRANVMVYVFNYTNHHCLVRCEDKIATMTILWNYYPVLNIVERGEAWPFG